MGGIGPRLYAPPAAQVLGHIGLAAILGQGFPHGEQIRGFRIDDPGDFAFFLVFHARNRRWKDVQEHLAAFWGADFRSILDRGRFNW